MNNRIIIIGGMGPQASLRLHDHVLQQAARNGAQNGDDFPEIMHASLPIKDFISDESMANRALQQISAALERLYHWQPRSRRYCL